MIGQRECLNNQNYFLCGQGILIDLRPPYMMIKNQTIYKISIIAQKRDKRKWVEIDTVQAGETITTDYFPHEHISYRIIE